MGNRLAALQSQSEAIHAIALLHDACSISVFGSVARGEERPESDVDFLVEFETGASLLNLMRLQDDLAALLGCTVDVVSAGGLKVRDEHIRREAIPVGFESLGVHFHEGIEHQSIATKLVRL